ncbi:MAG: hypothetical protein LBS16_02280 [Prevotellaceae bacterium]|jgi:hypothetical protein|nr:hypothetical protein [Prevotellaceae bacterium]
MRTDFIPRAYAQFTIWMNVLLNNLGAILVRIGFPADVFNNLDSLRATYLDANLIADNPATCTRSAVQARREARLFSANCAIACMRL